MTDAVWSTSWFDSGVVHKTLLAWRGVEAQQATPAERCAAVLDVEAKERIKGKRSP